MKTKETSQNLIDIRLAALKSLGFVDYIKSYDLGKKYNQNIISNLHKYSLTSLFSGMRTVYAELMMFVSKEEQDRLVKIIKGKDRNSVKGILTKNLYRIANRYSVDKIFIQEAIDAQSGFNRACKNLKKEIQDYKSSNYFEYNFQGWPEDMSNHSIKTLQEDCGKFGEISAKLILKIRSSIQANRVDKTKNEFISKIQILIDQIAKNIYNLNGEIILELN